MATMSSDQGSDVRRQSDAEKCRANGWGPGTLLVGDEGYGPTVIELTAVGQERILAKRVAHAGAAVAPDEELWVLYCRDWREVSADEVPAPFSLGTRVTTTDEPVVAGIVVSGPDAHGCYVVDADDGQRWMLLRPKAAV